MTPGQDTDTCLVTSSCSSQSIPSWWPWETFLTSANRNIKHITFYCVSAMIGSRMIDGTTTKSAPKKYSCMFFFSLLSELQQTIQLLSPYTLFFCCCLNPLGQSQESQCATITTFTYFQLVSVVSYHISSTWHRHGAFRR